MTFPPVPFYDVPSGKVARGVAAAPPSKSHTHRALICAALATGSSRLVGPLSSDDTLVTKNCLEALGVAIAESRGTWEVSGRGGFLGAPAGPLDCGSSGTTLRMLCALCAAAPGHRVLDCSTQLRRRPMGDLKAPLHALGASLSWRSADGFAPVEISGCRWMGGEVVVPSTASSQFLSGLLLASPLAADPVTLRAPGLVSAPYADLTAAVMARFGVAVAREGDSWCVEPGGYRTTEERIEPDASAAAFLLAAAAVTGGKVTVPGLRRDLLQGDAAVLDHLVAFGVMVTEEPVGTTAQGAPTRGGELDLHDFPDLVPPLAAVAFAAPEPSVLRGVGHLRHKESDRLEVLAAFIRALGGRAEIGTGELRILPPACPRAAELDPQGDHRMAMAGALMGLRAPGTRMLDPSCVAKSFPGFWDTLEDLLK